jgi:hexosaminidase
MASSLFFRIRSTSASLRALAVAAVLAAILAAGTGAAGLQSPQAAASTSSQAAPSASQQAAATTPAVAERPALIPLPASMTMGPGQAFSVTKDTTIEVTPRKPDLRRIAGMIAELVAPALEAKLAIRDAVAATPPFGTIRLDLESGGTRPEEGYELTVKGDGIRIAARTPAGIFYGFQTLRQLMPYAVEYRGVRPFAVSVPAAEITDAPRYAWRGAMLDVARHFFTPAEVKRYIDLLVLYKINRLHLHLTDDQGWRIQIAKWPRLTTIGGKTEVKGGRGGFYTKREYAGIVAYARDRFVTIIPEIDMPSHCNAALAAYPVLNCNGKAPSLYTGIEVGFSNFCFNKPITFRFLDDVIRELAAMTPGPWLHVGGDEVKKMTPEQYASFMERAQALVVKHGKIPIGWDEMLHSRLQPTTVVQYWRPNVSSPPPAGTKVVLSPANRIYLDMKYNASTVLGLDWAGKVDVDVPYAWDPAKYVSVEESQILGVEAPIWSETTDDIKDVEFLLYPRLPAVAELAWTAQASRDWPDFRARVGAQAPRWSALGVNAFWSPKIEWRR